ncbi:MAG: AmmeMemoRadiSam system protein A, partial [Candidatus Marinimicrobia bacterium]|nr:AmmeMemoRadiSam system protein A [Candidatus Neomarinimicrobiota bacterium]
SDLTVLPNTPIVPIVVGTHDWAVLNSLGKRLGELLTKKDILIVVSSDFSHYHSYSDCQKIDQRAVERIKELNARSFYDGLVNKAYEACGGGPITTLLIAAQQIQNPQIEILNVANSGDVPYGDKSAVVGYVAAALYQNPKSKKEVKATSADQLNKSDLTREEQLFLLDLAEKTVAAAVNKKPLPAPQDVPERLKVKRGAFVTLEKNHELRGCIGYILPISPLYKTVIEMAQSAALHDPRFKPVSPGELKNITVEISVLTVPEKITNPNIIEVGKHGIIMKRGYNQGLLLPQVATDYGWDRETFLEHTCLKAGLPRDAWQDKNTEIQVFSAQVFNRETVK